jgi:hypothetical protein
MRVVIGDRISAAMRRREVPQDDARHLVEAEQMCGEHPAVAGDNAVLFVDQHRVGEAKFADARADGATLWTGCRGAAGNREVDLTTTLTSPECGGSARSNGIDQSIRRLGG